MVIPETSSGWLMKPTTRWSPSITVMVAPQVRLAGVLVHFQDESLEILIRIHNAAVGAHQRIGPGVQRIVPRRETAGHQIAIAQDAEEAPGAMVVHHRHHGDIAAAEHDRHFACRCISDSDERIWNHHFRSAHCPNQVNR